MQALSDKSHENVRFNPVLELMVAREDSQITLDTAQAEYQGRGLCALGI
jgi:hypothetical protein